MLTGGQLKVLKIDIPSRPEQQKIADCFSILDDLITAQTQKKNLIQGLFPNNEEGE